METTQPKKARRKAPAKRKALPLTDEEQTRRGSELAKWLRIDKGEVTRLRQRGILPCKGGDYPLMQCVWAYHDFKIRNRRASQESTQLDMERDAAEKLHWQAQNEKTKNREWRDEYCLDIAERYRDSLAALFDEVRAFYERRKDEEGSRFMESVAMRIRQGDVYHVAIGASDMMEEEDAEP